MGEKIDFRGANENGTGYGLVGEGTDRALSTTPAVLLESVSVTILFYSIPSKLLF